MMEETVLKIEGMHCGSCATTIEMMLNAMKGVKKAKVDYDKGEGEIEFDPDEISLEEITSTIKAAGYEAIKKEK